MVPIPKHRLMAAHVIDPALKPAAFHLGKIAFQAQDYSTAVLWLSKLSAGDPGYLEASFFIGLSISVPKCGSSFRSGRG